MKLKDLFESENSSFSATLKKASDAIALARKDHFLWRGSGGERITSKYGTRIGSLYDEDIVFYLIKGRQQPRQSLTGNSAMMKLTTTMPEWEDLPRRDKSVFTTNSSTKASNFGQPGIVLPLNTVDKFATIYHDFNLKNIPSPGGESIALHELGYELSNIHDTVDDIFHKCAKFVRDPSSVSDIATEDYEALKSTIKKFRLADIDLIGMTGGGFLLRDSDSNIKENVTNLGNYLTAVCKAMDESDIFKKSFMKGNARRDIVAFQKYFNIERENLYDEIEQMLSPDNMGISLHRDLSSAMNDLNQGHGVELWFEGDYILIVGDDTHNLSQVVNSAEFKALL